MLTMPSALPGTWPASFAGGRYVPLEPLGRGGFATVLKVRDQVLGVERALKILHPDPPPSESARQRLFREARAMARLDHPHILRIYDVGSEGGLDFVVTELAAAGSLAARVRELGRIPEGTAARLGVQVLAGLEAAHLASVIHRDVKPQNILLDRRGNALLGDFGIALLLDDSARATATDAVVGSLAFMAPEQRQDARLVGVEADIYALGTTLFAVTTAANPMDLFVAEQGSARWQGLSPEMQAILFKATRMDPAQRYRSAYEMAVALAGLSPDSGLVQSLFTPPADPSGPQPSSDAAEGPRGVGGAALADVLGWERAESRSPSDTATPSADSMTPGMGDAMLPTLAETPRPAPAAPAPAAARASRRAVLAGIGVAFALGALGCWLGLRAHGPAQAGPDPLVEMLSATTPEACPQLAPAGPTSPVGSWIGELRGHPACLYIEGSGVEASATLVMFVTESDGLIGRIPVHLHGAMNRGRAIMLTEDLGGHGRGLTTRPEDQEVLQLILSQEGRLLQGSSYRGERETSVRFTRAVAAEGS